MKAAARSSEPSTTAARMPWPSSRFTCRPAGRNNQARLPGFSRSDRLGDLATRLSLLDAGIWNELPRISADGFQVNGVEAGFADRAQ